MKIKIVSRGGRLYGYGIKEPEVTTEDLLRSAGRMLLPEDVERICEIQWYKKKAEEERQEQLCREIQEKERIRQREKEEKRKLQRAVKIRQVLDWIKTGAAVAAMVAGFIAMLCMLCGEVRAAWVLALALVLGGAG